MLNLLDLKNSVSNLMERSDANMLVRIEDFINQGYSYLGNFKPWFALLRPQTFQSVSGLDYFITGQEVQEVIDISQRSTPIVMALQRYYAMLNKNFDAMGMTTGNPSSASPMGEVGIKTALPSDSILAMSSASVLDVNQMVRVRGYNTSLIPITETVSLNGNSVVSTTNNYTSKEGFEPRFSKDGDTVGTVTISSGATTIAEIAPTEREVRYKKWKVWPAFQSSITMYLTYKKRIYKLENNEDTPELECDNALIMFAFARCLQEKRQFAKAKEVYGVRDLDGSPTPGSFLAELDALVSREPQFSENFTDQFIPLINKDPIDHHEGGTGFRVWPR